MLDTPPALGPMLITPHHYQAKGFSRVWSEFDSGKRSTLAVMATGTGKSIFFGLSARNCIEEHGGRVLVLAHVKELLSSAINELALVGVDAVLEKADQHARCGLFDDPACVVASVQTMKGRRLKSWPRDHFDLIITDEAQHAIAGGYQDIYKHFNPRWHLGVTATPDRLDGENLGQVYQSVAYEYSLREAIAAGDLCRLKVVRCETSVDLRSLNVAKRKDLSDDDIAEALTPHIEELANAGRREVGNRRFIGFAPSVKLAIAFASAYTNLGLPTAAIHGDSPDRDEIVSSFRHGKVRGLMNCQLFTEGANFPFCSAALMYRPTMSRALYSQMVGRITRKHPGKPDALIIDFAYLTDKHQLVAATELFDTTGSASETQSVAEEIIAKGDTDDLMLAIERAEGVVKERQTLRIKAREREVRYRRVSYDPMAVMDVLGMPARRESASVSRAMATDKQVATLEKFGVVGAADMSKLWATKTLNELFKRIDQGLATMKQVSHMVARGVDPAEARAMSKAEASARLDVLFNPAHAN